MRRRLAIAVLATGLAAGCGDVNAALQRVSEARRLSADLAIAFAKASNATDRAVMADTDAASVGFGREAVTAKQAVHQDVSALRPLLAALGFTEETGLLDTFDKQLARYEALDRQILELAVENTNLKAQRLSYGAAQDAAEAFARAIDAATPARAADLYRLKASGATAIAAVREIQVLQAPHIADPDDSSMSKIETRMKAEEAIARRALADLPRSVEAAAALDRFMEVNRQIVGLSRQNTNVRSLALALNQKQALVVPCEQTLRRLNDALAQRGFAKGRWE
jgi:hypothetical protein